MKKNTIKVLLLSLTVFVALVLTACNTESVQVATFGVEDLPTWIREMSSDADWQRHFDSLTPEELELFFTEGLGAMHEPPVAPEGSGHQTHISFGGGEECSGAWRMDENGMECVDLEELLESDELDDETRENIREALGNQD